MPTQSYKDLIVWQKAKELALAVYRETDVLPRSELYGLTSQMRRAAISVSSNIAESYHRFHTKEKNQFLAIAFASGAELESQIEIAKALFPQARFSDAEVVLGDAMRILNTFLRPKS
jgi:four helix bundle protein